ncbi:MAG TPA: transposase, partial [Thermoanaerobaculia bacterium]|nr:transposase [Thermoanaerobaculia bacterium]HQN06174.1 transposase [Thermoanaerobaculia bacterium]HQP87897.1 transposase [Thermoanaerobaculia bacterium]
EACGRYGARAFAWCLMPNHIHLALQTGSAPISRLVHDVHSRYAQYFNRRWERSGHLFQGRFQGIIVDREGYLLEVVRYIHRNPVKARLVARPEEFPWSSHGAYLSTGPSWLASGEVLGLLAGGRPKARRLFQEFVTGSSAGRYDPDGARFGAVVGGEDFVRTALAGAGREDLVRRTLTVEAVVKAVAAHEEVSVDELTGPSRLRSLSRVRSLCALLGREYGGIPFARTARFFGRDASTISRDVAFLERRLAEDPAEARRLAELRRVLAE